jgi:hypothetical protein
VCESARKNPNKLQYAFSFLGIQYFETFNNFGIRVEESNLVQIQAYFAHWKVLFKRGHIEYIYMNEFWSCCVQ